jgi:hypothetical protein
MVVEEHGLALFEAVKRLDLEGVVASERRTSMGGLTVVQGAELRVLAEEGRGELFERRR